MPPGEERHEMARLQKARRRWIPDRVGDDGKGKLVVTKPGSDFPARASTASDDGKGKLVVTKPGGLYRRQPLGVGIVFALYDVKEGFLQKVRDRAPFAGSDLPVIDFPNRRHFGGCPREEHLLGHV